MMRIMCGILFVTIFLSCQYDEPTYGKSYPEFDATLWPYLEAFEAAASARNVNLDLNNLDVSGDIEEIAETRVAGYCQYSHPERGFVRIDKSFWEDANADLKEFVVFHELGHCVLRRLHREDQYRNGACVSIMQSGTGTCRPDYREATRELYLDELFSPTNF